MAKKKFTLDDYDNLMEGVRQKRRTPIVSPIQRLRESIRGRKPKLPRI